MTIPRDLQQLADHLRNLQIAGFISGAEAFILYNSIKRQFEQPKSAMRAEEEIVPEELPRQALLAKLLKMTTSINDAEALVAIRKANELLRSAGWDWDKLIEGKIKVAADPFANLGKPYVRDRDPADHATAPPPRAPFTPPPPRPKPPPPPPKPPVFDNWGRPQGHPQFGVPPPPPRPFEPYSERSTNGQVNAFAGNCYCCGFPVDARQGKLFLPGDFNPQAVTQKKKVICIPCDNDPHCYIGPRPAPQPQAGNIAAPRARDL